MKSISIGYLFLIQLIHATRSPTCIQPPLTRLFPLTLNMELNMPSEATEEFYIVGAFEAPHFHYFPTHLQPIIAEKTNKGFRRWTYTIEVPYGICPRFPIGSPNSIESLFPVRSFILLDKPILMQKHSQLIAIRHNKFLVSSSKLLIIMRLTVSLLSRLNDSQYRKRVWMTICNSFT